MVEQIILCFFVNFFFAVTNSQDFKDPFEDSRNDVELEEDNSTVKSFTFREIATATKNFRQECLLGEGGFGKVFKGTIQSGEVKSSIFKEDQ